VQRPSHHLLARAGFTRNENRAAARSHQPDDIHHVAHGPALTHQQAPPGLAARSLGRVLEIAPASLQNRHLQVARQLLPVERFATKIIGAHLAHPKRFLGGPGGLVNQDRNPPVEPLDFFEQPGWRPLLNGKTG
jgi:hypothetical protein